ncbi:hypothetical protein F5X68DRAFT_202568 [Plectosphaerella plurivora]|uniref:DUF924 domain-containing protein n=1 Tax=Plectosphaerella plurivora TaxID=936078 RepID=A0A9P8VGK7_9PEZI|nr:hypothetical protein F5X68DRAFT_202568 [Plectosphaerella plurivora]
MEHTAKLRELLNPALFERLRHLWFGHISDEDHIFVPSIDEALVWFTRNDGFDNICSAEFGATLASLRELNCNGMDIMAAVPTMSALDWMSLIILLDQLPRNCYRDDKAGIAYSYFDPLAQRIALEAIKARVPEDPEVRYKQAYRFWFYMPLEHSESMHFQDMLAKEQNAMFGAALGLSQEMDHQKGEELTLIQAARGAFDRRQEALEILIGTFTRIAAEHRDVLERFGRYPRRNQALDRTSTKEEEEFLLT